MRFGMIILAGPALVAGLVHSATAQVVGPVSPDISEVTLGLFCAPPEGERRPAPGTMAGWVHVPDGPVEMRAEGTEAPAVLGLGFGARYRMAPGPARLVDYTVTHPPMPPLGTTSQTWQSIVEGGETDTVFFQFDVTEELQPGDWSFVIRAGDETLFTAAFTVRTPADLPALANLCRDGTLLSFSPSGPAAAG